MTPEHIDQSIARALKGESYLDPEVLKITGFSTKVMRHLFNNLCHIDGIHYLEVGVYCGATFIAAFNGNPISATGIDDFSQDFSQKDVRGKLSDNLWKWHGTELGRSLLFFDCDCFEWAVKHSPSHVHLAPPVPPFDIFCYDGHHDREPTSRALPAFFELLADTFIYIVDDFHWESVRNGTIAGFQALDGRVNVEQKWFLSGKRRQDDPVWWNGVAIFLCSKIK